MMAAAKAGNFSLTRIDSSMLAKSKSPERVEIGAGAVAQPKKYIQQNNKPKKIPGLILFFFVDIRFSAFHMRNLYCNHGIFYR